MEKEVGNPDNNHMRFFSHANHFDHHGPLSDMAGLMHDEESSLDFVIKNLPRRAAELEKLSSQNPDSEFLFMKMVRQSFEYVETIIDLQEAREESGIGSQESQNKDKRRGDCHKATIDVINAWSRSLARAETDNSFLRSVFQNRVTYGLFAVGLALDIYTDQNFQIEKYSLN